MPLEKLENQEKDDTKEIDEQGDKKISEDESDKEGTSQDGDDVEKLAREKGHVSLEEWKAQGRNGNEWIDAKEFVERGPLYDAIHKSNREIKRLKEANLEMKKWYDRLETTTKDRLLNELKGQLKTASEEKDIESALDIKDKISTIEKEENTRKANATNEVFSDWVAENEWYESDADLKLFADGIGQGLYNQNPNWKLDQIYEEVSKVIKRKFPDKFGNSARNKQSTVESGTKSNSSQNRKKSYSFNDLPDDAKTVYKRLVKSDRNPNGLLTSEEFFKDYLAVSGELNK